MYLAIIFFTILILSLIYMHFEVRNIKIERIFFSKKNEYLKILQLSDIHIDMLFVSVKKIVDVLNFERPDLIIITGDFIRKPLQAEQFFDFLSEIRGNFNICLCLGNHDFDAFHDNQEGLTGFIKNIKALGIEVLDNKSISVTKNTKKYNIIGISDLLKGNPDVEEALKICDDNTSINIAFSHNPDIIFDIHNNKIMYLFCGHYHGGQIWTPFGLEYKYIEEGRLYKMGIKRGLHLVNGINLYINRGLGNEKLPFRFLSRPEITVFYIP